MDNKISIIIITYNEEKTISGILSDLTKQSFQNFEIIISDSNSSDKTQIIANKFKNKFKEFSFYNFKKTIGPSYGRNYGAKKAKYDYIYFFDADTRLDNINFLKNSLKYIKKNNLDAGSTYMKPSSNLLLEKLILFLFNIGFWVSQFISPTANGSSMFCKKSTFNFIGGFDDNINVGEDSYFVNKIKKNKFNFKMIPYRTIFSNRRFEKEGYFKILFFDLKISLIMLITGKSYKKNENYFEFQKNKK